MRFDATVSLLSVEYATDAIGQEVPGEPIAREIYANEFSLSSAEFYDAGLNGLKPERQYQVRSCDYAGEKFLEASSVRYEIVRTERRGEWTRLTCQKVSDG